MKNNSEDTCKYEKYDSLKGRNSELERPLLIEVPEQKKYGNEQTYTSNISESKTDHSKQLIFKI